MKGESRMKGKTAFTLIELLIVVAIIAILAAIAVPNFLEAQIRSKVSRVKADMRTAATALEAYRIDWSMYPHLGAWANHVNNDRGGLYVVTNLTTPVAYLTTVNLADPFSTCNSYNEYGQVPASDDISFSVHYMNNELFWKNVRKQKIPSELSKYVLLSLGPDYVKGPNAYNPAAAWGLTSYSGFDPDGSPNHYNRMNYDPSNGSKSGGDILRFP